MDMTLNIGFAGFGLIAASLALSFKDIASDKVSQIYAYDINQSHIDTALERNMIDAGASDPQILSSCDIIFLATPVRAMASVMQRIAPFLKADTIITDVGSVKEYVIETVTPYIPKTCHFIPGHPVAGKETSGPEKGINGLFKNRTYVLTPLSESHTHALDILKDLIETLGACPVVMDAKTHDQTLAFTSHMPHVIAFSSMIQSEALSNILNTDIAQFNGGSYEDMTRVATADLDMWRDVFLTNADNIRLVLKNLMDEIDNCLGYFDDTHKEKLEDFIQKAQHLKKMQNEKKKSKGAS